MELQQANIIKKESAYILKKVINIISYLNNYLGIRNIMEYQIIDKIDLEFLNVFLYSGK